MRFGLQLGGTPADGAALAVLAEAAPHLSEGTWSVALDAASPASVLASPELDPTLARVLARRGLALVTVEEAAGEAVLTAFEADRPPLR